SEKIYGRYRAQRSYRYVIAFVQKNTAAAKRLPLFSFFGITIANNRKNGIIKIVFIFIKKQNIILRKGGEGKSEDSYLYTWL
ncbi:MAG: hypothetical protein UHH95_05360, partial [Oscillospiraceae bacterium]|nr:hypothetical protein [Oscillospiraceae bacterium]